MVDCLHKFLKEVKIAGHVTNVLLSDGGKEFNCEALQSVLKNTVSPIDSLCHILPNRTVQQSKKIVQLWKALAVCFMPVDCRKDCGLRPLILLYTYSTLLDLHQWNCGLDHMQLFVTCVFSGQNVLCTFPNRRVTSGTQRVGRVDWSDIWVKRTAIEFGCLTNGRLW